MITGWFRTFRTPWDTWKQQTGGNLADHYPSLPENFKGGDIWNVIASIHGALQAIGYALLVLFFVVGVVKTCGSFTEVKKPEHALKLFIRFALAKGRGHLWTGTDDGRCSAFVQGMVSTIMDAAGFGSAHRRTGAAAGDRNRSGGLRIFLRVSRLWAVTLIGGLFVTVLSFIMIMSVYGRFLPAVSLYRYRPGSVVYLCRGSRHRTWERVF